MSNKNLTIIVPIYNPAIPIEDIFNNLYKQKSQNFDVVVTIDRPKEEHFIAIDELHNKLKDRLKVVFNTTHQHIDIVINDALKNVETPYVFILYSYCKLKNEFIQRIDKFLEDFQDKPDFVEMPGFSKSISHSLIKSELLSGLGLVDLEKNALPFALVTPFVFNTFVKTEIAKKVMEIPKTRDLNLEYSPNLVFRTLLNSKTFAYFPDTWIENWNYSFLMFNPKSLTRSWNIIFKEVPLDKDPVKKALSFAKCINYCYYVAGILGTFKTRKNSLESKSLDNIKKALIQEIENLKPVWLEEMKNNNFFLTFDVRKLFDLTDGFVKKWDLIFKKFIW